MNEPLPDQEEYSRHGDGINISANYINQQVVDNCKRKGKKIGVWIKASDFKENDAFYKKMFELKVDFICSDFPLRAMEIRRTYKTI